jgi:hypothetical protein
MATYDHNFAATDFVFGLSSCQQTTNNTALRHRNYPQRKHGSTLVSCLHFSNLIRDRQIHPGCSQSTFATEKASSVPGSDCGYDHITTINGFLFGLVVVVVQQMEWDTSGPIA